MFDSLGAEQYLPAIQQISYRPDETLLMTKKVCNRAQNETNACQTSDSLFLAKGE